MTVVDPSVRLGAFAGTLTAAEIREVDKARLAVLALVVTSGRLRLAEMPADSLARCAELMAKYRDLPMKLADATLVVLGELRNEPAIFTLDTDFEVYRLQGRKKFRIIPELDQVWRAGAP